MSATFGHVRARIAVRYLSNVAWVLVSASLGRDVVETPDFKLLFQKLPGPFMVLDRELRYVDANDAYLQTLERRREDLIGMLRPKG